MEEGKLKILVEGAKYDVSCSSAGSKRRNLSGGLGDCAMGGICHSFTEDGRCISLLKILMSNDCIYNCKYCVNRCDNDVPRATATPEEICELVIGFYKRNYIEGLFLSSAVFQTPDKTMEQLVRTVKLLRTKYRFNGYIHLKGIPHADPLLMYEGGKYADRMSYNLELPSEESLKLLAPQKTKQSLLLPMKKIYVKKTDMKINGDRRKFLPAGQTTQMIVGASSDKDGKILRLTQALYDKMHLKRVYYSAYMPVVHDSLLPEKPAGLLREHRLYQADWLLRFYGFTVEELLPEDENLPLDFDPKCAWALRHPQFFPVEVNSCPLELLLRVPGIGARSAQKITSARKYATLRYEDLIKMRVVLKRAKHFITCNGKFYGEKRETAVQNLLCIAERSQVNEQLSLFSTPENTHSCLTGEL